MSRNAGDREKKDELFFLNLALFGPWSWEQSGARGGTRAPVGENCRPGGVGCRIRLQGDLGSWCGLAKGGTETAQWTNDALKSLGE